VGWAVVAGLGTLGAAVVPGLTRATKVRAERDQHERVERERRRDAIRGRLERWERLRRTADESHERFARAVERCHPGPLRDRLRDMRPEVDRARDRVQDLVELGIDLEGAVADSRHSRPAPTRGGRRKGRSRDDASPATRRLEDQRDEVERRAQDIDTSLASAVAVAFELTLDSIHAPDDRGVDGLVTELETLRDALAELREQPDPA
jgi:hypothetical protein